MDVTDVEERAVQNESSRHTMLAPRRGSIMVIATLTTAGTLAVGAVDSPAVAGSTSSQYGTLSAPDGVLPAENQCGRYSYGYDLSPPSGTWELEVVLRDPRGDAVASYVAIEKYSGGDAATVPFTLCRNSTTGGVFTLSARISTDDGNGHITANDMSPATFTLTVPEPAATVQSAKKHATKKHTGKTKKADGKRGRKHGKKNGSGKTHRRTSHHGKR